MDERLLMSFESIEDVHWWFVARRDIVMECLRSGIPDAPEEILEVGCGTGAFLADLARVYPGARARGVEPSSGARDAARRLGCDVVEGVFDALPASDESIDLVVALDVLEHCESEAAALSEAYRVLRPGGHLLLTVPAMPSLWSSHDTVNGHYRRYTAGTLRAAVDLVPLETRRITYFDTLLLPFGAAARTVGRVMRWEGPIGVGTPVPPLNRALLAVFRSERALLRRGNLPRGMSLLLLATKPPKA